MDKIAKRLSEPSSWAGLSAIVLAIQALASRQVDWMTGSAAVLGGVVAVLKPEAGSGAPR